MTRFDFEIRPSKALLWKGIVEVCIAIPSLWSKEGLSKAIVEVTKQVEDVPTLLAQGDPHSHGYRLRVYEGDRVAGPSENWPIACDEEILFAHAALFEELDELTLRYIDVILAHNLGNNKEGILLKYSSHWKQNKREDQIKAAHTELSLLAQQPLEDVQDTIEELSEGCDFPFDAWKESCEQEILAGVKVIQQNLLDDSN